MTVNESWIYQGRQYHGWFGHGTSPHDQPGSSPAAPSLEQRIYDIGHTLVAGLPLSKRHHDAARLSTEDQARLGRVLTATVHALPMGRASIAGSVFGLQEDAAGLGDIIQAARLLRDAKGNAALRAATDAMGRAAQAIGLDRFVPFLRDADAHLAKHGGLLTLARAMPGDLPVVSEPAVRPFGLIPWAVFGAVLAVLPAVSTLALRGDVQDVIQQFRLDRAAPADVVAAYAYLWAENHGPWLFDTPLTGPAMQVMARRVMAIARTDPDLFRIALAGDAAAQHEITAVVAQPELGRGIVTLTEEERDLVASLKAAGRTQEEVAIALGTLRRSWKSPTATERRYARGWVFVSGKLPGIPPDWLTSKQTLEKGAAIPQQIADKLAGRPYANFKDFREALWRAVAAEPALAGQFDKEDLDRMKAGTAPLCPLVYKALGSAVWTLHHRIPLSKGGSVYDLSNIVVVTPLNHSNLHYEETKP